MLLPLLNTDGSAGLFWGLVTFEDLAHFSGMWVGLVFALCFSLKEQHNLLCTDYYLEILSKKKEDAVFLTS